MNIYIKKKKCQLIIIQNTALTPGHTSNLTNPQVAAVLQGHGSLPGFLTNHPILPSVFDAIIKHHSSGQNN